MNGQRVSDPEGWFTRYSTPSWHHHSCIMYLYTKASPYHTIGYISLVKFLFYSLESITRGYRTPVGYAVLYRGTSKAIACHSVSNQLDQVIPKRSLQFLSCRSTLRRVLQLKMILKLSSFSFQCKWQELGEEQGMLSISIKTGRNCFEGIRKNFHLNIICSKFYEF